MLNCEQVTRAASDFIERRLRLRDHLMVLMHIVMCGGCRAYLDQLRLTLLGLRSLRRPTWSPSEDLFDQFRRHFRPTGE